MKNRRDVCLAKDVGCISYPGLSGHIKTGCTASPAYKSRYCQQHQPRSCKVSNKEEGTHLCYSVQRKQKERHACIIPTGTSLAKVLSNN